MCEIVIFIIISDVFLNMESSELALIFQAYDLLCHFNWCCLWQELIMMQSESFFTMESVVRVYLWEFWYLSETWEGTQS